MGFARIVTPWYAENSGITSNISSTKLQKQRGEFQKRETLA